MFYYCTRNTPSLDLNPLARFHSVSYKSKIGMGVESVALVCLTVVAGFWIARLSLKAPLPLGNLLDRIHACLPGFTKWLPMGGMALLVAGVLGVEGMGYRLMSRYRFFEIKNKTEWTDEITAVWGNASLASLQEEEIWKGWLDFSRMDFEKKEREDLPFSKIWRDSFPQEDAKRDDYFLPMFFCKKGDKYYGAFREGAYRLSRECKESLREIQQIVQQDLVSEKEDD